jgi:hypothetical protein
LMRFLRFVAVIRKPPATSFSLTDEGAFQMASSVRLAGVRYPLTSHPTIDSGQRLQPEVLPIPLHAGSFP